MKSIFPILAGLLLLSSCEKNIKVELPTEVPKLVLNAVIRTGQPINLALTRTTTVKEARARISTAVSNATAILFRDGAAVDTLDFVQGVESNLYTSNVIAEPGKTYKLRVEAKGFQTVEASALAPAPVAITGWTFTPNARQSSEGGYDDGLDLTFSDPGNTRDFYVFRVIPSYHGVTTDDMDLYSWGSCVYTSDPSVESSTDPFGDGNCISSNNIFVQDALFNGTTKEIKLFASSGLLQEQQDFQGNKINAHVILYHVSEDFYQFLKSYRSALESNGNPFSEPVNVRSNVQNGYGVFAILNTHTEEIDY